MTWVMAMSGEYTGHHKVPLTYLTFEGYWLLYLECSIWHLLVEWNSPPSQSKTPNSDLCLVHQADFSWEQGPMSGSGIVICDCCLISPASIQT